jgi:hypothetical protein
MSEEMCSDYGQGHQISVFQIFRNTYGAEATHLIGSCGCLPWVKQLDTESYVPVTEHLFLVLRVTGTVPKLVRLYGLLGCNFSFTINEVNSRLHMKV